MLLAADVVGLVLALVLTTLLQQDRLWSAAFATRVGALLVVLPLFVVGGKYSTDVQKAGGPEQLLRLVGDLTASERHH